MTWPKLARRIGGTVLFTIGTCSLVLPILPGVLLIAVGLYLLSVDSPSLTRRFAALCERYSWLDRIRTSHRRFFRGARHDDSGTDAP